MGYFANTAAFLIVYSCGFFCGYAGRPDYNELENTEMLYLVCKD